MKALEKPKAIVICGPTGCGKTSLSINLAEQFNGLIIGADSMQIYKFMDIGTAKPTPEERTRVFHYLIDIVAPDESYDAARYGREARDSISRIIDDGKIPFVVGGTGFYIRALLGGLCDASPADPQVRKRLKETARDQGGDCLYERLKACDPDAAAHIHPNDTYRIVRALEIFEISGKPMSFYQKMHGFKDQPFEVLKIGVDIERRELYKRIDSRVDQMIAKGFLNEVNTLVKMGYTETLKPMQSIGYRHMFDFLNGRNDWETIVSDLKQETRRYAKRQMTWFRKDTEIIWKNPEAKEEIESLIREFLKR